MSGHIYVNMILILEQAMGTILESKTAICETSFLLHRPEHLKIAVDLVLDAFENEVQHEAATKKALQRATQFPDADVSTDIRKIIEQLGLLMDRSYRQKTSAAYYAKKKMS